MNEPTSPQTPTRSALAQPTGSASYPLWKHMHDNHGLILLESEMDDMLQVADEMRMKRTDGVVWILVNALRHLDNEQLKRLRTAITKRITPNRRSERQP